MRMDPLQKLASLGQSIWLDFINRKLITSGALKQLIKEKGVHGVTSNPSIFEKAIAESDDYIADILYLHKQGKDANAIYETLTQQGIQAAADEFLELYQKTSGQDGYVSLEVNPHLAYDTAGTISEARRLWQTLDRPNVLIKIPATREGLPAITQLISEGININVTLLFGVPRYQEVANAYVAGLEARAAKGEDLHVATSVASFFLSRIDSIVDSLLGKIITQGGEQTALAEQLLGQTAIASAKMAYQFYLELTRGERFKKLAEKGAHPQRLLWASTSTKNPAYSDVKYIEALIGHDTINTVPMETLDAYFDHGQPTLALEEDISQAKNILQQLPSFGINIDTITQQLEDDGVNKFAISFDHLMRAINDRLQG